ncbi:MAG: hypothetical protein EA424_26130 [Planctomycetaceae bacterium]|nr:MAG: hypothetical protein EA424_26130 [Planctomycetaceae bacterium]
MEWYDSLAKPGWAPAPATIGMIPLTGTSNAQHVQADLEVFDFRMEPAEGAWIEVGMCGEKRALRRQQPCFWTAIWLN